MNQWNTPFRPIRRAACATRQKAKANGDFARRVDPASPDGRPTTSSRLGRHAATVAAHPVLRTRLPQAAIAGVASGDSLPPREAVALADAVAAVQRPKAAEKQKASTSKAGKASGKSRKGNAGKSLPSVRDESARTTARAAKAAGMSRPTYERAKAVGVSGKLVDRGTTSSTTSRAGFRQPAEKSCGRSTGVAPSQTILSGHKKSPT